MFYSKKTSNNWFLISSALLGGFALGLTYKKYGKEINNHFKKMTGRNNGYEDYMTSHEPDA